MTSQRLFRTLTEPVLLFALLALVCLLTPEPALAHGVAEGDTAYLESVQGIAVAPFMYLGAKHMVTGYDHLLFLLGVVFYLTRLKDVALYVSLFAIGHSTTLLYGVLSGIHLNAWLIDAVIGFSVIYKALDNLNIPGFSTCWQRFTPDLKWSVWIFGLIHGFGLATKLQDTQLNNDGLIANMLAFNLGVELGQILALMLILMLLNPIRRLAAFPVLARTINLLLLLCGMVLMTYQLSGFLINQEV